MSAQHHIRQNVTIEALENARKKGRVLFAQTHVFDSLVSIGFDTNGGYYVSVSVNGVTKEEPFQDVQTAQDRFFELIEWPKPFYKQGTENTQWLPPRKK